MTPAILERRWARFGLIWLAWMVYGVLSASRTSATLLTAGRPLDLRYLGLVYLIDCTLWALLTPGIIWVTRRLRGAGGPWRPLRILAAHVLMALGAALVDALCQRLSIPLLSQRRPALLGLFLEQADLNVFCYFTVAGLTYAVDYFRLEEERAAREAQLGARLLEAELSALKLQLQPHFLFNTLHAIAEVVHVDAEAADRMLTRLGDLLRLSLDTAAEHEVPLSRELSLLNAYLAIEQVRFHDRLTVDLAIDEAALPAQVPSFVLQPLLENAIRHGLSTPGRGSVQVRAARDGDSLHIQVRDSGPGFAAGAPPREGVGLRNTRARLLQLYGPAGGLELGNQEEGGGLVRLRVPFRTTAAASGPGLR